MKIGDSVTLTVKNPLWDRRKVYAYAIAELETYTGTIVPNPIWVGADQLCLSTGTVQFPFRVLDRDRIVGLSEAVGRSQSRVFNIVGAKGKSYVVTAENGLWGCNCVGFGYRRSCSHVVEAKNKANGVMAKVETEKKVSSTVKKTCFNSKYAVQCNSRKNEVGGKRQNSKLENVKMATQSGLAFELYRNNNNISCEEFVAEFAKTFPNAEKKIAALYWQNKARRAQFGLAKVTLPAIYKTESATAKVPTERKAKDKKPKVLITKKLQKSVAAKVAEIEKSSFEIDIIKEANLSRMKAVTAKMKKVREYGPGRTAVESEATPDDFDPQLAREEVAAIIAEIDRDRSAFVGAKVFAE